MLEECEVIQRLQVQQDVIQELRNMIEYQVSYIPFVPSTHKI